VAIGTNHLPLSPHHWVGPQRPHWYSQHMLEDLCALNGGSLFVFSANTKHILNSSRKMLPIGCYARLLNQLVPSVGTVRRLTFSKSCRLLAPNIPGLKNPPLFQGSFRPHVSHPSILLPHQQRHHHHRRRPGRSCNPPSRVHPHHPALLRLFPTKTQTMSADTQVCIALHRSVAIKVGGQRWCLGRHYEQFSLGQRGTSNTYKGKEALVPIFLLAEIFGILS
jgi:hypothetical protein